jgi:hypothetical protein
MNRQHLKKLIAPIIVALVIILYYTVVGTLLFKFNIHTTIKIVALVPPALTAIAGIIYVLVERAKEINGGEEDDLGKY